MRTAWWTAALLLLAFAPLVGVLAEHAAPTPASFIRMAADADVLPPLTTAAGDDDPVERIHRLSHHLLVAGLPGLAFCSRAGTSGSIDVPAAVLPGVSSVAEPVATPRSAGREPIAPLAPCAVLCHASRAPPLHAAA